ncbi:hypothetical protein F4777DRAFT_527014 [Nemania sp. FL0916]|nr:hypothetical protein F4777DRAFT_527014 [Nemania sp. FL0916]
MSTTQLCEINTSSYWIGITGGKAQDLDHDAGAAVSTPPDSDLAEPASQSRLAISMTGVTMDGKHHTDVYLCDNDEVLVSPTSAPQHKAPPSLLSLPVEIRLEIYAHLLTAPSGFPPPSSAPYFYPLTDLNPLYPCILRTCRQVYAECAPILYRSNTFLAHTSLLTVFPSFFSAASPRKKYAPVRSAALAGLVTRYRVRVRLDAAPQYARHEVTAQFSGKAEVVLEAWQAEWRGAGPDALRLFEGVRDVRFARVTGSTSGFAAYARWLERAMMAAGGEFVRPFSWDGEDGDGSGGGDMYA